MILAKIEILEDPSVPEGVKHYFRDYAGQMEVFGHKVLHISTKLHWRWEDELAYKGKNVGIAPSHSVDLMKYESDMPDVPDTRKDAPTKTYKMSVNTWIHDHSKKSKLLIELHEIGENHDDCGHYDD